MEGGPDQSGDLDNSAARQAADQGRDLDPDQRPGQPQSMRPLAPPWVERIRDATRTRFEHYREHKLGWRLTSPLIFVAGGVLFVTSAISADGNDLRPDRYNDLADLAQARSTQIEELTAEVASLQDTIDELTERTRSPELDELTEQVDELRAVAGRLPVVGPGVTVTLNDAPKRILDDDELGDISRKIVHQQDIQAVANALLAAGAEAITVQGQRIVSTTGIKCVGSSVLLQGIAYPPPYVISAIGNVERLTNGLEADAYLERYRDDVEAFELGWQVDTDDDLEFPGYTGSLETAYAQPLG